MIKLAKGFILPARFIRSSKDLNGASLSARTALSGVLSDVARAVHHAPIMDLQSCTRSRPFDAA
jgi:hypothetical protein